MEKLFRAFFVLVAVIMISLFASGCSKKKVETDIDSLPAKPLETVSAQQGDSEKSIYESGMAAEAESLDSKGAAELGSKYEVLEGRTHSPLVPVYYDFDRSSIRADQRSRIEKNGEFLATNMGAKVLIEGNCDERGTNEYNMALGERRAKSSKKYLVNLGIKASRLETISYGEEKPLLYGHDEYSWAQNRRADFIIVK